MSTEGDGRRPPQSERSGHRYDEAAGLQTTARLGECIGKRKFGFKVLEEIAGEYRVKMTFRYAPFMRAVLLNEGNSAGEALGRVRVHVHRVFLRAFNIIDELSIPAAEVKDTGLRRNQPREELRGQNLPDFVPIRQVFIEPVRVDRF